MGTQRLTVRILAVLFLTFVTALVWGGAGFQHSLAQLNDSATVGSNSFNTDALNPPTGLTATGGASVTLNWTATVDTYASGHRVLRGTTTGGPYSQIAEVTPRTTTTYGENPASGTYYYVVRAFYQNWESGNSNEASATVSSPTTTGFRNCTANAAVTTNSGDNNGYEGNTSYACTDDAYYGYDSSSGTNTSTSCSDSGKDRHRFYNYGFSIPAGSAINGVEVRLDAYSGGAPVNPFICVELSWDGGTSWTAAKTTGTLGSSEATFVLGTSSDTWGRTWASGEFSDTNLRVRLTNVDSTVWALFKLDWVAVQVTYTSP